MLRARLVLTNLSWSSKNTEILFDIFLGLFLGSIIGLSIYQMDSLYKVSLVYLFVFGLGYWFLNHYTNQGIYTWGLIIHLSFFWVLAPIAWMGDWVYFCVVPLGLLVSWASARYFRRLPVFWVLLVLLFLFRLIFPSSSLSPDSITWWGEDRVLAESTRGWFGNSAPSLADYLSMFSIGFLGVSIFRRPILLFHIVWIFGIFVLSTGGLVLRGELHEILPLLPGPIFFFLSLLLPGRSLYGNFFLDFGIGFFILGVGVLLSYFFPVGFELYLYVFLFFLLEEFILAFFMGQRLQST
jgi:hypothetical protein